MEKRMVQKKKIIRRAAAWVLAVVLISGKLLPAVSALPWSAEAAEPGDTMIAYGTGFHHYCIDGVGANRALIDGDEYEYILPSETLSREETALIFWGTLTLQASFGNEPQINAVIRNINAQAADKGSPAITNFVTEADLKLLIHSSAVRGKYPWLKSVLAQEEAYLKLAGLIGNSDEAYGSGLVPAVLQGHTQPESPVLLEPSQSTESLGEYTLSFDPSGKDAEFIRSVPLKYSVTGADGSFTENLPEGWVCRKTDTQIRLTATGAGRKLYLMFDVRGTKYGIGGGSFSSPEEVYEQCLQIWRCSRCAESHRQMYHGAAPLTAHQRLAYVEVQAPELCYYAGLNGGTEKEGGMTFEIYRHAEDWTSTYNLRLRKEDHETGQPLENAVFSLYESFEDQDQIHTDRDGAAYLYAGGAPYQSYHKDSPVVWEDFRFVSSMMTDGAGEANKTVEHGYHYDKTFCDGHPAPVFVSVPEEEEDEETGEVENQAEIDAAKEENRRLAALWLNTCTSCEAWAFGDFSGVHFHWCMPEVDAEEIENLLYSGGEEGTTPGTGSTVSADEERSFADSGCEADTRETYERFIALRYSYAIAEDTAREGYTFHGNHKDDLPVEVITTDASENGANAYFAGLYGHEIRINDEALAKPAENVRAVRQEAASVRMTSVQKISNVPKVRKERHPILQKIFSIFFSLLTDEEVLTDDRQNATAKETMQQTASASNVRTATASDSRPTGTSAPGLACASTRQANQRVIGKTATASDSEADEILATGWTLKLDFPHQRATASTAEAAIEMAEVKVRTAMTRGTQEAAAEFFSDAYNSALIRESSGSNMTLGSSGHYSHCSGKDGEDDRWRIYDHRTEGEIHINKRDMDLKAGESGAYDSYADAQGDAVLEGAVYGLFADEDLVHPDGKTGVVYQKNNLVAVTSTDKNGDASFLACTEAPGRFYHYAAGQIEDCPGGWRLQAPSNLYDKSQTFDDYTEDGQYIRSYPDQTARNGNCWIGRPLFMGNYYVKELSRSEGYELSVGNRQAPFTNAGQDLNVAGTENREGYAVITKGLYAEQQVRTGAGGAYGDPTFQELFFEASSENSGGFDLAFYGIPEGSRLYRLDTKIQTEVVQVGTGRFLESVETDLFGRPVYAITEYVGQYPKYQEDGSLLTRERAVSRAVTDVEIVTEKELDPSLCEELMQQAEGELDESAVMDILRKPFERKLQDFVKYKLERILRANGKGTPRQGSSTSAGTRYTTLEDPVYDTGYRDGKEISFGSPIVTLKIPYVTEQGEEVTTGEVLAALLDYYQENAYYSYGGLDGIREKDDGWEVSVYAGRVENPECFYVPENEKKPAAFYLRISYVPDETTEMPRYCYAIYTEKEEAESFGIYTDFKSAGKAGSGTGRVSAILLPDASADVDGNLITRCISETVYYEPGENPLDADGNRIPKLRYEEETVPGETQKLYGSWTEIPSGDLAGIWHVESNYTDVYGVAHSDSTVQTYQFKLVLPGAEQVTLTKEDALMLSDSWSAGDAMGAASYYLAVRQAGVRACLDYAAGIQSEENSFVKRITLTYPGQNSVWQDGSGKPGSGTQTEPLMVEERSIRQRIRVSKTIEETSYRNTSSYANVQEDDWVRQYHEKTAVENFRFKVYLKSNLQDLYRNEQGEIIWQDRKGNDRDFAKQAQANAVFPEKVNRIYTRVLHRTDPLYKDTAKAAVYNTKLYAYEDGLIQKEQNPGYTALLETVEALVEDGEKTRTVTRLNYQKFFDAIEAANHDKWDAAAPTYTSFRPIGNSANHSEDTLKNALVSDQVRQFAITWYLDEVMKKLVDDDGSSSSGATAFSDELLDRGMREAIEKAENYLKPFFAYDLDSLYAIAWDEAPDGGADRDKTTLSADQPNQFGEEEKTSEYYGISAMLPYGTYVVVEQQPRYAELKDFKNRHYETDQPKEIELPAVYTDETGAQSLPGILNPFYRYRSSFTAADLEKRYQIRFLKESRVIRAHSDRGDFEIYPYGLSLDQFRSGIPETLAAGDHASLSQSAYRPLLNYYNEADDRTSGPVSYYLSEGQSGREAVSSIYRYSSVSEQACVADDVGYPEGVVTEDNVPGIYYRDQVACMQGSQTAYDGLYAPMLVPYSVIGAAGGDAGGTSGGTSDKATGGASGATSDNTSDGTSDHVSDRVSDCVSGGISDITDYGNVRFCNRLYTARLRIEKLDFETHENILHDGAVFSIYAAKRDDSQDGNGTVLFYENDTQICGSKDFLTAMGAEDIRPILRGRGLWNRLRSLLTGSREDAADNTDTDVTDSDTKTLYTGVVPAGTPVCEESQQILLGDRFGLQIGMMKAFVTVRDGRMEESSKDQLQTVGYLQTPQPLSAGTYVLCEMKAPKGYARSKPVALEIYSDQITYYQNGDKDARVLSAVYEDLADEPTTYETKTQDVLHTARIYLENEPIRLQVEKKTNRTDSDENVQEQADPDYASGALMTLFDAIALTPSGDFEDFSYEGLVISRDDAGHVERMYVKEGYGGEKTEFLPEQDEEGRLYTASWSAGVDRYGNVIRVEGNVWNLVTVMRPDTDILYYDLSDLVVEIIPETDGKDGRYQAFAWKGATKFLEFEGGDLTQITYDEKDKILTLGAGTQVYHLGRDGARDALVDPYTGMAYVVRDFDGTNGSWDQIRGRDGTGNEKKQVLVWPVNIRLDDYGNVIARDKISTSRMALAGEGDHTYITGSWQSDSGEESHRESSILKNAAGQNLNDEVLLDENTGSFGKTMDPVYDRHGLVEYYPKSSEHYDKATELYDRNGDFVRSQFSDNLNAYDHAAYEMQTPSALLDETQALSHRKGEAYILENTWITSKQHPNDPDETVLTEGKADVLERLPAGCYIMEELKAPEGLVKALPMGIFVQETAQLQTVTMTDEPTQTEFSKIDEENSAFDCGYVEGAELGLWKVQDEQGGTEQDSPNQVHEEDQEQEQTQEEGQNLDREQVHGQAQNREQKQILETEPITTWTTEGSPYRITRLPVGSYLWKEIRVPSGFVSHTPTSVIVKERPELQTYEMKEEHTRIEVEKYALENGKDSADGEVPVKGAGFTLYPARLDDAGNVCHEEGKPLYEKASPVVHWTTDDGVTYRDFPEAFETMYLEHGAVSESSVMWNAGEHLYRAEYESEYEKEQIHPTDPEQIVYVYRMETGERIRIGVTREKDPVADFPYRFEYQFNWQKLSEINEYACTYLTLENRQRFDYLPVGSSYVLVETEVPPGFARAENTLITVSDTGEMKRYRVENEEGTLLISKVYEQGGKELAGAKLALYRADEAGGLTRSSTYLFDAWVSGSDGRYTELDAINRRIPEGYAEGDLKPHRIRRLPNGSYWLVEQQSPAYYSTFRPVQIQYEWQPKIRIIRVNDELVTGKLDLEKTDSSGHPLEGAVFELSAYSQEGKDRDPKEKPALRLNLNAPAKKNGLPVGEVMEDGSVRPYWYELREIQAPEGYALNPEVIRLQFEPDTGVGSYLPGQQAQYQVTVPDRKETTPPDSENEKTPPKPDVPDQDKPKIPNEDKQGEPEEKPKTPGGSNPDTPKPEPVLRLGRILAWYQPSSPNGTAWLYLGPNGKWRVPIPVLGDNRKTLIWCVLFIVSSVLLAALYSKEEDDQ